MKNFNGKILRIFFEHTRRYSWRTIIILSATLLAVGTEIAAPWYMRLLADAMAAGPSESTINAAQSALVIIALLLFVGWVAWRAVGFLTAQLQPRIKQDLEEYGFAYLIHHSYAFFTNAFAGSLVRKVRRLSHAYEQFADEIQFRFLPALIIIVGAITLLALRFPVIAIIFSVWIVLFFILNYFIALWILKLDIIRAEKDSEVTGVLADALTNSVNIKLFTGHAHERGLFHTIQNIYRVLVTRSWYRNDVAFTIQSALTLGIYIALLVYGLLLWRDGTFTVGDLVLIQGVMIIVIGKIWDISRGFRHVFSAFADAREMVEILETPHEVTDRKNAGALTVPKGKIQFSSVTFHYHKTRRVLNKLKLTIKPVEKIALVGPSGAGKSTIVKLLFRFVDVTSGHILIDGQDIARVTQESLREHIALVPQDPILFHRSIMENIRYGRRDATDKEVMDAAKKARCHDFIKDFPQGYDTLVGERGVKLSGGERQRVAIARAILKNPPILVLDEATSNLDSESEQFIQEALHELMQDKTVIVIAHRLSTIMEMDRILVIENGRVTASGTHRGLLKRKGTYKRLWNIQAGGFAKQKSN
jgi:ATP-binding cassette, subfamily B, bacterial